VSSAAPVLKLWSGGITGNPWSWFHSYLSFHQQCVSVNGYLSSVLPVKSGVLQDSILGPLLFLIYINELSESVKHSTVFKFADDAKCYKSINTQMDSTHLQQDLNSLFQWSINNRLSFNISKCVVLQRMPSLNLANNFYYINKCELAKVVKHKDLGIIFTTNLSWYSHYEAITAKAYKSIDLIR